MKYERKIVFLNKHNEKETWKGTIPSLYKYCPDAKIQSISDKVDEGES